MRKYLLVGVDSLSHPDCRFNIEHLDKNITGYRMLYSYVMGFKTGRVLPALLAALILAACSGQAPQTPSGSVQAKAGANSDYYLQQMQQAGNDSKTDLQLLAIHALITEGKTDQAQQQLGTLPQALSDVQRQEQILLSA